MLSAVVDQRSIRMMARCFAPVPAAPRRRRLVRLLAHSCHLPTHFGQYGWLPLGKMERHRREARHASSVGVFGSALARGDRSTEPRETVARSQVFSAGSLPRTVQRLTTGSLGYNVNAQANALQGSACDSMTARQKP